MALRSRLLERTVDSGPWPCDFPSAVNVKLKKASDTPIPLKPDDNKPGIYRTTAQLKPSQIQDLADVMGDIVKAAAGQELKFTLTVELGGGEPVPEEVRDRLNEILGSVDSTMKLE